eukprot:SAG22_NODE_12606_length_436_cov_0.931751_1_plen_79_part_10
MVAVAVLRRAAEGLRAVGAAAEPPPGAPPPPPHPRYHRGPRFRLPDESGQMLRFLAEEGYAVVAAVLDEREVAQALEHT